MNEVSKLHKVAMSLAGQAVGVQRIGGDARDLFRDAFENERAAAMLLVNSLEIEPTRSILFRSAASLAMDCGEFREAERLIGMALAGNPPEEICEELRDLYENVTFNRHLEVKGTTLGRGDVQLSLAGGAVGLGIVAADEYFPRAQRVESMMLRTAERTLGLPFRERGKAPKSVTELVSMYTSLARAGSFAVTLRVGRPTQQKLLFEPEGDIVLEFMECLRLFNEGEKEQLKKRVNSSKYFVNFVAQARQLAPDGDRVKTVGFTASYGDDKTTVALRQPDTTMWRQQPSRDSHIVEIKGVVTKADKDSSSNTISVREENGVLRKVKVPAALLDDIVRPYWGRTVLVRAEERNSKYHMSDIEPVDENPWTNPTDDDDSSDE